MCVCVVERIWTSVDVYPYEWIRLFMVLWVYMCTNKFIDGKTLCLVDSMAVNPANYIHWKARQVSKSSWILSSSLYVCVRVCMCPNTFICTCPHGHVYLYVDICVFACVRVLLRLYVCVCVCISAFICVCTYVPVRFYYSCVLMYVCVYICMYVFMYERDRPEYTCIGMCLCLCHNICLCCSSILVEHRGDMQSMWGEGGACLCDA